MAATPDDVEIGVFGGTGLYSLLAHASEVAPATPYGEPSGLLSVGEIGGRKVAFLPRHGAGHIIPPHLINYRANISAMKQLGVRRIIAPTACGSLQPNIHPGQFVVSDQFVDLTSGRRDTFFEGPQVTHVSAAEPYCPEMRSVAVAAIREAGVGFHESGVCVVIQGPRFSTRAESSFYTSQGWHTINMTQYPEVILAREMGICYVNVGLVTDYDAGLSGGPGTPAATAAQIVSVLDQGNDNLRTVIDKMVRTLPRACGCSCASSLDDSTL